MENHCQGLFLMTMMLLIKGLCYVHGIALFGPPRRDGSRKGIRAQMTRTPPPSIVTCLAYTSCPIVAESSANVSTTELEVSGEILVVV